MKRSVTFSCWILMAGLSFGATDAVAQRPLDAQMDTLRVLASMGDGDQRRIAQWVEAEYQKFQQAVAGSADQAGRARAFKAFRERLVDEFKNTQNTPAFKAELAAQTSKIAVAEFAKAGLETTASWALTQVLVDLDSPPTVPGLLAALRSNVETSRYLAAVGLNAQKAAIGADQNLLGQCTAALQAAGTAEQNAVVLSRVYVALSMRNQVGAVVDPIVAILDARLAKRRSGRSAADRAELDIFGFFGEPAVVGALSAAQKTQLIGRLAVFFRLDAQRYAAAEVTDEELEGLERRLTGVENAIRSIVGGSQGGDATALIGKNGHEGSANVLVEVYKWTGNSENNTQGVLNGAPWNVPVGAP